MPQCQDEVGIATNLVTRCVKEDGHEESPLSPEDTWHTGYTIGSYTNGVGGGVRVFHQWRDKRS